MRAPRPRMIRLTDSFVTRLRDRRQRAYMAAEYRHRREPRGAEQTAWSRAIAKLVGAPGQALPGCGIPDAR
jgi:hypothetical protein